MTMRGRSAVVALTAAALAAGLLAPTALAKKTPYVGPILPPPAQDGASSVSFKVVSKPRNGSLRAVAVKKFFYVFANIECSSSEGPRPVRFSASRGAEQVPLRKRRFSQTIQHSSEFTIEVEGRVPRKGTVTGTMRIKGSYVLPDIGTVSCDSTVSWKADVEKGPYWAGGEG
jgi:hypothetical protein